MGGSFGSANVLLLTTIGRKSGRPRTTPLNYFPDGERVVLVASNGGADNHPAWYLNLLADPAATIQRKSETSAVIARIASAEEKAELWPRIVQWYRGYATYQQKTDHDIPLIVLDIDETPSERV